MVRKYRVFFIVLCLIGALVAGLAISANCLHITSSNAIIYLLRGTDGVYEITNHLRPGEAEQVERMVNLSWLFSLFARSEAVVSRGRIELTWNEKDGDGVIKEFRSDGTEFLVVLSRYSEDAGTPQGVFIGGDLPLGDTERTAAAANNNTGVAYFDGSRWNHIWCTLNESLSFFDGDDKRYGTAAWTYLGSTVRKADFSEAVIESRHELKARVAGAVPVTLLMTRTIQKKLGEDYVLLKVEYRNPGDTAFAYSWELGDEPWVGDFYRGSKGNVGWASSGLYKYESYVSPMQHSFAGYWDIGNDAAGESGKFTGYADFIEWLSLAPEYVYFANDFGYDRVDPRKPLSSQNNRVVALTWLEQRLKPGERKEYLFALGMARPQDRPEGPFPVKPATRRTID